MILSQKQLNFHIIYKKLGKKIKRSKRALYLFKEEDM